MLPTNLNANLKNDNVNDISCPHKSDVIWVCDSNLTWVLSKQQSDICNRNLTSISVTDPAKWDSVLTDEEVDKLAPLLGGDSLPFLVELGMDFQTWEQISHRQLERDLVKINRDILEERK